jgi:hypothetical protein
MSSEQETFFLALAVKPFVAFVVMLVAALIARAILVKLPEGKLKSLLSRRVGP